MAFCGRLPPTSRLGDLHVQTTSDGHRRSRVPQTDVRRLGAMLESFDGIRSADVIVPLQAPTAHGEAGAVRRIQRTRHPRQAVRSGIKHLGDDSSWAPLAPIESRRVV